MRCRCSDATAIDETAAAEGYLRQFLEPERVRPDWTISRKAGANDPWEELTCGRGVFRCKVCGARWEESHEGGDRGRHTVMLRRLPTTSPDDYLSRRTILDRAERLSEAQHAVWRAFERSSRTGNLEDKERWIETAKAMWSAQSALYSPDLEAIVERLRSGDPSAVEPAVVFLEADPWCFRSGYLKENLMRYLARIPLADEMKERLRHVIAAVVVRGPRRELSMTRRLARAVASPGLVSSLQAILQDDDLIFTHDQVRYVLDGVVG